MKVIISQNYKQAMPLDENARRTLQNYDLTVVETATSGPYEFYLFFSGLLNCYQIGLQNELTQCTDFAQQSRKIKYDNDTTSHPDMIQCDLSVVQDKIREWLNKYTDYRIAAASMNPNKTRKYKSALRYLGFDFDVENFHGHEVLYLKQT